VTWQQTDMMTSTTRIASNRYTKSDGWGIPQFVDQQNAGTSADPLIGVDYEDTILTFWPWLYYNGSTTHHCFSARYTDEFGWEIPEYADYHNGIYSLTTPDFSMSPAGGAFAVWVQEDSTVYNIMAARFTRDSGWGEPELAEFDDTANALYPRLSMNPDGQAIIVWMHSDGYFYQVWANLFE
jgi:hypothetical protein